VVRFSLTHKGHFSIVFPLGVASIPGQERAGSIKDDLIVGNPRRRVYEIIRAGGIDGVMPLNDVKVEVREKDIAEIKLLVRRGI